MKKADKNRSDQKGGHPNFGRVSSADLKKSRKGKHHDLMHMIMEDLRQAEPGYAVQVPLSGTDNVSVLNLRSAIVRAAAKENIKVVTSSDNEYFYAWKADAPA